MLMPARTAPVGGFLLIAVGVAGSVFVASRQIQILQIRKADVNVARMVLSDILVLTPIVAGIVGLLQPHSEFPFLLVAIAAGVGLFVLFSQSWTLVLHGVINADKSQRQEAGSRSNPQGSEGG